MECDRKRESRKVLAWIGFPHPEKQKTARTGVSDGVCNCLVLNVLRMRLRNAFSALPLDGLDISSQPVPAETSHLLLKLGYLMSSQ